MDIRELMIGDWVFYKNEPIMVYGINDSNDDRINYEDDGYGGCSYICADEVSPIPLTVEILEKNGFKKKRNLYGQIHFCYTENDDIYCNCNIEPQNHIMNNEFFVHVEQYSHRVKNSHSGEFIGYILYVHELQNILRSARIEKEIIL